MTKYALKAMEVNNYGRVLHLASIAGKEGNPNMAGYSSTKAGVIGLVKGIGKEYAETGYYDQRHCPGSDQYGSESANCSGTISLYDRQNTHETAGHGCGSSGTGGLDCFGRSQFHHRLHLRFIGRAGNVLTVRLFSPATSDFRSTTCFRPEKNKF